MKKIAFILFLFAFLQINVAPCQNTSLFMEYLLPNSKTEIFSFLFFVILFILGSHGSNSKEKIIIRKLSIGFFIATFLMYIALPSFPISIAIIKAIIWSLPAFVSSFLFSKRGRMLDQESNINTINPFLKYRRHRRFKNKKTNF